MTWSFQDTNLRDFCDPRPVVIVITFGNQEFEEDEDLVNDGAGVDTGSYNRGRLGHFSPGGTRGLLQHSHSWETPPLHLFSNLILPISPP